MLRILLQYLLPLALPFLAWLVYARLAGRTARAPWLGLAAAGVGLMAVSLVTWGLLGGAEPGEAYVPAHIEDGRVVPGKSVEP